MLIIDTTEEVTMQGKRRNGVAYNRYSRLGRRNAERLLTIDSQEAKGEDVADQYGVKLVGSFEDRGKSGGTLDREGLQAAIAMIESGEAQVLVAAKLNRLARSTPGALEIIRRVNEAGGQVILGDLGPVDMSSPFGKMVVTILAAVAEMELDNAREYGFDSRASAVERGILPGATPYGYERPDSPHLVPHPVKGPIVTEIFRRKAGGATWGELAEYVFEQTGEHMIPQTLAKMIKNPTYLGSVRSGDDLKKEGAHEPLTDPETWEAAQSSRRLNSRRKHESLLAGLMTCANCGRPMTHRVYRPKRKDGTTREYPMYQCQRNSKSEGRCPLPVQVLASLADQAVIASFLDWSEGRGLEGDPTGAAELIEAEQAVVAAEADRDRWLALDLASVIDGEAYRKTAAKYQLAIDQARERLTDLRSERRLGAVQVSVPNLWPSLDSEGKRQLIAQALDSVMVHRSPGRGVNVAFTERAEIVWREV